MNRTLWLQQEPVAHPSSSNLLSLSIKVTEIRQEKIKKSCARVDGNATHLPVC